MLGSLGGKIQAAGLPEILCVCYVQVVKCRKQITRSSQSERTGSVEGGRVGIRGVSVPQSIIFPRPLGAHLWLVLGRDTKNKNNSMCVCRCTYICGYICMNA